MNTLMKKTLTLMMAAVMAASLAACGGQTAPQAETSPAENSTGSPTAAEQEAITLTLSDSGVTMDGQTVGDDTSAAVYLSHDIIYYEDRDTYDSGNAYGEGAAQDRHSAEAAAANTVVNIAAPGTYRLQGQLPLGQVRVDLGEEAAEDPAAVVTLILDGVDVTCDVAPAILFLNVYECDNGWSAETATSQVDTSAAGANVIIADGSVNNISGSYVARIYKDTDEEKKLWKQDGAFYSYMSMNVDGGEQGTGVLNLQAENEGLDTEHHLTINGGNINITAGNDGINTNEDGVSVTTINGGSLHIVAGLGAEGDGIDSNGWLVINGGTVISSANPASDAGLDSDMGSYVNGGRVVALGSTMDWAESDSQQVTMNLQFADYQDSGDAIIVTDESGAVVFAYDPSEDEVLAENTRRYMGAVISCPEFAVGATYQVYTGGTVEGDEISGVYDPATVTGFSGAVQQAFTGTDVRRGGGGMGGGRGQRPEGEQPPELPEGQRPEKGDRTDLPEGERPALPDGQRPELPDGQRPDLPEGEGGGVIETGDPDTAFYMQDKVNNFSGLTAQQ